MPTGCRFYPKRAIQPMSTILFEHMSNSAFPQTSEVWLLRDFVPSIPLINFHPPRSSFQVFNLGIPFVVKPPLSGFQLDLYFSFFFLHFLWFKLPFQVFTLNFFFPFSFHFYLPKPLFRVFNSNESLPLFSQA